MNSFIWKTIICNLYLQIFQQTESRAKFFRLCKWLPLRNAMKFAIMFEDIDDLYSYIDPDCIVGDADAALSVLKAWVDLSKLMTNLADIFLNSCNVKLIHYYYFYAVQFPTVMKRRGTLHDSFNCSLRYWGNEFCSIICNNWTTVHSHGTNAFI